MGPELEQVPELMQHIQSWLPVKEAARTSVLSKSWLHAWSTSPTLRFHVGRGKSMKLVDVDRTLIRYLHDNTPMERFELKIDIENQESASHAEKWIKSVATKTCLKELSLSMDLSGASVTLPDEILSGENLTKIRVSALPGGRTHSVWMTTTTVINCVSLRELHLEGGVRISEEVLNGILSSCSLLVKIVLLCHCKGLKTIKVKNLPCLYQLQIALDAGHPTTLEISGVPNLGVFSCDRDIRTWPPAHPPLPFNACSISLGSSVTRLMLGGLVTDNACLDMLFKSGGFPFLESLTLHMTSWKLGGFHLTCASIKRLTLLMCPRSLIDVQVHAPELTYFRLASLTLPSLLFPVSSLKQLNVSLALDLPVDANFFLKLREALTSSRKCYLLITINNNSYNPPGNIDLDDLRTRLLFPPARNVQQLGFVTRRDECLWERSPFFDAFFEICHPKHVVASSDGLFRRNNHFYRLMLREVLDKKTKTMTGTTKHYWPHYLKHVQIRQNHHQKWKTLTNLHRSFLDGSAPGVFLYFKLNWR